MKLIKIIYIFFQNRKFDKKIKDVEKEEKMQAEKEAQRLAKIREKEGI